MHGRPFPRTYILIAILTFLLCSSLFGQKEGSEINITKSWTYAFGDTTGLSMANLWDRIFVGLENGKVEAISLEGKKVWASDLGGRITSNLLATESGLFLVNSSVPNTGKSGDSKLRSISKDTGITNWIVTLQDAEQHFLGLFNGVVIVVAKSGTIESIDAGTGKPKWKRQIAEGFVAEPLFTATGVIVATAGKQIFSISLSTGEIESMRKVPYGITALGWADNNATIVGDERGNVTYYTNGSNKGQWTFKSGGEVSRILPIEDDVLVTSHDNFVYFISNRSGSRLWKRRFVTRVSQVAKIGSRYAIMSALGEMRVEAVDTTTGKVAGQITIGEDEALMSSPVSDPSGRLFFLTNSAVHAFSSNSLSRK